MLIAETHGLDEVQEALDAAGDRLAHMMPVFRSMANWVLKDSLAAFRLEEWHGEPWPPLAQVTIESPIDWGPRGNPFAKEPPPPRGPGNILHPTGVHLLQTISVLEVRDNYAKVGTPNPWAHVHNEGAELEGTAFGDITIPRRTFLAVDKKTMKMIDRVLGHYLRQEVFRGWR